jgi:hypothetical protein
MKNRLIHWLLVSSIVISVGLIFLGFLFLTNYFARVIYDLLGDLYGLIISIGLYFIGLFMLIKEYINDIK